MTPNDRTSGPPDASRTPTPRRRRPLRVLGWLAGATIALLALLAIAAAVLLGTEWGARTLWQNASRFMPGRLAGDYAGGTLKDGIRLRNVAYSDDSKDIRIDRVDGAWRFSWSPPTLTISALRIGSVDMRLRPTPPEPLTLPAQIRLPIALDLRSATIGEVMIHKDGSDSRYADIRAKASSDGIHHRLALEHATTPFGETRAALDLNGVRPFALQATGQLVTRALDQDITLNAKAGGSVEQPLIDLDVSGKGVNGTAHIEATPLASVPLRRAQIKIKGFDPSALNEAWPQARLDLDAALAPAGNAASPAELTVTGPVDVRNAEPGRLDEHRLPLASARVNVTLNAQRQQLAQLEVALAGGGRLRGGGELRKDGQGEFTFETAGIDLHALHGALIATDLAGPIRVGLAKGTQTVTLDVADTRLSARANVALAPDAIRVESARLASGPATLDIAGRLGRDERAAFDFSGELSRFDPARFFTTIQPAQLDARTRARLRDIDASVNMSFRAEGALHPEPDLQLRFDVKESRYAGLPMTGGGTVRLQGKQVLPSDARLDIAGNVVELKGSFGQPSDRLRFRADAPALAKLGFGLSGLVRAEGELAGTPDNPRIDARYHAEDLRFGPHRLGYLDGAAKVGGLPGAAPAAPVRVEVDVKDARSGELRFDSARAAIDGAYDRHTVNLEAVGQAHGARLKLALEAGGRLLQQAGGFSWDGIIRRLRNDGLPQLSLAAPVTVRAAPNSVEIGQARLDIEDARIDLRGLRYAAGRIDSQGELAALNVGRMLRLMEQLTGQKPPVLTDLVLDGSWNLSVTDQARGFVSIERRSGDLRLPGALAQNPVGLSALSLRADLQGNQVAFVARTAAQTIGSLDARGTIGLDSQGNRLNVAPDAPVRARINASVPDLGRLAAMAGPSVALTGSLAMDLGVGGTLADPRLSGTINGDKLALTLFEQGVRLEDGTARIAIEDNIADLRQVIFHGGSGTLTVTGRVPLANEGRDLQARIIADKLQLLASPAGQLTLSGQATAARANEQMQVVGQFTVDRALFSLPEKSAPKLDDDVVVIRGGQPEKPKAEPGTQRASPFSPRIDVTVGLGRDFHFAGAGADLRLAGSIRVQSEPGETPQAFGTVRIAEGSYEAFGAKLGVERGVINFQGPLANPNLNILAMRRNQEVAAGVQISGTARQPRVQLVSEPNVSEEEKLSWLVFGRSGGSTGQGQAQSAAKGAALGLLNKFGGSRIAKGFGLDEFSIGASEYGLSGEQVVNLGKTLTDRLYIGYEQSLAGAESVLKLTYELTRYWTVTVRGGTIAGLDLFYNRRFDRLGGTRRGRDVDDAPRSRRAARQAETEHETE